MSKLNVFSIRCGEEDELTRVQGAYVTCVLFWKECPWSRERSECGGKSTNLDSEETGSRSTVLVNNEAVKVGKH